MKKRINRLFAVLLCAAAFPVLSCKSAAAELGVSEICLCVASAEALDIGWLFMSLALGAVLALAILFGMVRSLKSVRSASRADSYIVKGSMRLVEKRDIFLYRNVEKRQRPKPTERND